MVQTSGKLTKRIARLRARSRFGHCPTAPTARKGFTLLEMTLVVVVLAALSVLVVASLEGVQSDAEQNVARSELRAIREAVNRFKADTGHLPKRGPFALIDNEGLIDPSIDAHWPSALVNSSAAERADWFGHPANFHQLYERQGDSENLLLVAGCLDKYLTHEARDAGKTWNAQTSRGFRGPYLSHNSEWQIVEPNLAAMPVSLDPWGRPYRLELTAERPYVFSFGPDGEPSDDDQIAFLE
jgi:prepilin-type N-terminal cleavage/methylation domain-containing protein